MSPSIAYDTKVCKMVLWISSSRGILPKRLDLRDPSNNGEIEIPTKVLTTLINLCSQVAVMEVEGIVTGTMVSVEVEVDGVVTGVAAEVIVAVGEVGGREVKGGRAAIMMMTTIDAVAVMTMGVSKIAAIREDEGAEVGVEVDMMMIMATAAVEAAVLAAAAAAIMTDMMVGEEVDTAVQHLLLTTMGHPQALDTVDPQHNPQHLQA